MKKQLQWKYNFVYAISVDVSWYYRVQSKCREIGRVPEISRFSFYLSVLLSLSKRKLYIANAGRQV